MTTPDIAALKALREAVPNTEPWRVESDDYEVRLRDSKGYNIAEDVVMMEVAEYIVALVNAAPALLAQRREDAAEIAALREVAQAGVCPACGKREPMVMRVTDTATKMPCTIGREQFKVCGDIDMCRADCPHSKTVPETCGHPFHAALANLKERDNAE